MSDQSKQNEQHSGDTSSPAPKDPTAVRSNTPENREGHINPSAPGNTGTTPGTNAT